VTGEKITPPQGDALRRRAEDVFPEKAAEMPENMEALSPVEARQMFHELRRVHHELEMQHEELRRALGELEVSRSRYFDLYDLAPVGYVILSEAGLILEANLAAATLLDVARSALVKTLLTLFLLPADMVSAVEARDPYTAGHQTRSADLARAIATEMGLPSEKIEGIRVAGSIHDIGKLSIPAEILSKPTKLSELEFSLIKEHARRGFEILKDVESPWPLAEIVDQHHERMDGSGYPRNLKGDAILIEARIIAVADVVESMASHRPYRPALGLDAALEELEKNRGTLYDEAVVDACLRLFREKGYRFAEG